MTTDSYPVISSESEYKGFSIFIENSPDQYCGGYEYCVANDSEELVETGLSFSADAALNDAQAYIDAMP